MSEKILRIFGKIPGNINKYSRECSRKFRGIDLDLFHEILLIFYKSLLSNCEKNKEIKQLLINSSEKKFSTLQFVPNLLHLNTFFLPHFSFLFFLFLCWEKGVINVRSGSCIKKL